jgi:hypothetical protein
MSIDANAIASTAGVDALREAIDSASKRCHWLSIDAWLDRDLPQPERLVGEWLTTTSRVLLNAPTGLGKTNLVMAIAGHAAAGKDFLHWPVHRPARVLFLDGEMSRRLLRRRAQDVVRRLGQHPAGLHLFNHEDAADFQPLNTPAGKKFIEDLADDIGELDLIIFDNVMSLVAGVMKEEEGWQAVLPLITSLTKRAIGQIWVHHMGHNTEHGYGTSTREWRMDTVIRAKEAKRSDTDVSFTLEFSKARERTPETRRDFEPVTITLLNDEWNGTVAVEKRRKPSPLGTKFLETLQDTFATGETVQVQTWSAVPIGLWKAECAKRGLIDLDTADTAKAKSATTLFNKYRRELIAGNLIACNETVVWLR